MFKYTIETLPLACSITPASWRQVWYADDASTCGNRDDVFGPGPALGTFVSPLRVFIVNT